MNKYNSEAHIQFHYSFVLKEKEHEPGPEREIEKQVTVSTTAQPPPAAAEKSSLFS